MGKVLIDGRIASIYTSYYDNWRNFPKGYAAVGISGIIPEGFGSFKTFAPLKKTFDRYKEDGNEQRYIEEFKRTRLDILDRERTLRALVQRYGYKIILCCYEKEGFCHRHIVAEWLGVKEL